MTMLTLNSFSNGKWSIYFTILKKYYNMHSPFSTQYNMISNSSSQKSLNGKISNVVLNENIEEVFVDGSCFFNGTKYAKGGIGIYFKPNDSRNFSSPLHGVQTNNRAELMAVYKAINLSSPSKILKIYSDSKYIIGTFTTWSHKWIKNNWIKSNGLPVKNKDLIFKIFSLIQSRYHPIIWKYVKAHSNHYGNREADALARQGSKLHIKNNV